MATSTQICKVCGKEYPYCRTARPDGLYRWDNVACCPEHAAIYFAEVEAARSGASATTEATTLAEEATPVEATQEEDEEYELFDPDFEEDFDDSEEESLLII